MTDILLRSSLAQRFQLIHVDSTVNRRNAAKGRIGIQNTLAFLRLIVRVYRCIFASRATILYTLLSQNLTGFLRDAALVLLGRLCGCRIVCHLHGANFSQFFANSGALMRRCIAAIVRCIDRIVVLSDGVGADFAVLFARTKTCRIHNAIAAEEVARGRSYEDFVGRRADGREGVTVLFLGLLSQAKGFHDLLKAIPKVVEKAPTTRFAFAGEILETERNIFSDAAGGRILFEDGRALRHEIVSRYPNNLRFHGIIAGDEKFRLLMGADILVLPSYSEGFPMVILEAMAVGLPVITTRVGALGEVLQDGVNALFVPVGDPQAVADGVISLIDDPERRRAIGRWNYREVRERFRVEQAAGALGDVFEELISESRGKVPCVNSRA